MTYWQSEVLHLQAEINRNCLMGGLWAGNKTGVPVDTIAKGRPNGGDMPDQVRCSRCGHIFFKDDCYRNDDGGWLCEGCAEKVSDPIPYLEQETEELMEGE